MHKLASTPITMDCFETDDMVIDNEDNTLRELSVVIDEYLLPILEKLREKYNETKDIRYWKEIIRWLPESWLQTRTVTMSYANLRNIYHQRKGHKLTEWKQILNWIETLPYAQDLIIN